MEVTNSSTDISTEKREILDFSRAELERALENDLGLQAYRGRQIIPWLYRQRLRNFQDMSNISKDVRELLSQQFTIYRPEMLKRLDSVDGSRKYLFRLSDNKFIESVLIKQPTRFTLCISSQVGCAIGCKFCRTGTMGLTRHLRTSEIIGQVLAVQDDIAEQLAGESEGGTGLEQFKNIVFMGMGEPLHNYDNVVRAVDLLNDELGLNFSSRKITVSTSGLVPAIKNFGEQGVGANLAVSLNATTDEVRSKLIPINRKYPLSSLLGTLREFPLKSRRRITMEYVMLKDVNDTQADLDRLPSLIRGIPVKVNLIPYNSNSGLGFYPPSKATVAHWQNILLRQGINATVRWSKGQDIDAACGQLAVERNQANPQTSEI